MSDSATVNTTVNAAAPAMPTLPPLVDGATLKLVEPRSQNDATFCTKKGRPVDAVCVDHAIVETSKGTPGVRLLFVVISGLDENDNDVKGHNIVTDKYLSPGAQPYTFADLRFLGWKVEDGKEIEAAANLCDGDLKASGLGNKIVRVDVGLDEKARFTPVPIRVKGISQQPVRLSADDVKKKLAAGLVAGIKASKDGRPKADNAAPARNPTSPPPGGVAAGSGPIKTDTPAPWDL